MVSTAGCLLLSRPNLSLKRQETRPWLTSFDLVLNIRKRRLIWIGHILRGPGKEQPAFQAVVEQSRQDRSGNLLMDVPIFHLIELNNWLKPHATEHTGARWCAGAQSKVISDSCKSGSQLVLYYCTTRISFLRKLMKRKKDSRKNRVNDLLFNFI